MSGQMPTLLRAGLFALGVTFGFTITVISMIAMDFFDIIPFEDSAFTGAIVGALIAGVIGVSGQLLLLSQTEISTEKARKLDERAKLEKLLRPEQSMIHDAG